MLLALVTSQRSQILAKLDTTFMQELPDKMEFTIRDTVKTTRPAVKHLEPIQILAYGQDPRLCFVKTPALRKTSSLLISYTKPHKAVTNSTVAR